MFSGCERQYRAPNSTFLIGHVTEFAFHMWISLCLPPFRLSASVSSVWFSPNYGTSPAQHRTTGTHSISELVGVEVCSIKMQNIADYKYILHLPKRDDTVSALSERILHHLNPPRCMPKLPYSNRSFAKSPHQLLKCFSS